MPDKKKPAPAKLNSLHMPGHKAPRPEPEPPRLPVAEHYREYDPVLRWHCRLAGPRPFPTSTPWG
ncbi:MAG TPA: hypothetical protein VEF06_08230 [Bryobacteraceae bacterium]|nr:hypothetical protein [Bryobacteraceae bacterium]